LSANKLNFMGDKVSCRLPRIPKAIGCVKQLVKLMIDRWNSGQARRKKEILSLRQAGKARVGSNRKDGIPYTVRGACGIAAFFGERYVGNLFHCIQM
jgi:hypothetical protein